MDIPSLFMIPSAVSSGKVHSVFPNSTDADFDFNRDSSATRVNSQGLIETVGYFGSELITNGDFSSASDWTITNNTGTATEIINGYVRIKTDGAYTQIEQTNVTTAAKTYKLQYTVLESDGGDLGLLVTGNTTVSIPNTVGTHIYYFVAHSTSFIFKRRLGALDIKIDNVSVKEVTGDRARLNYEIEGGLVNTKPSLLLEPQSTNKLTTSNDFSSYSKSGTITLTSNYGISPTGERNSTRVQFGGSNNSLYKLSVHSGNTESNSIYIKGISGETIKFGKGTTVNAGSIFTLNGDWQRIQTQSTTGNQFAINTYSSVTARDIEIFGAQIEEQSYATSLIPTNGSTQTRAAETCNGAGTSSIFESTEGILYAEYASLGNDGSVRYLGLSDGSSSNRVVILNDSTTNNIRGIVSSGGTKYADFGFVVSDVTTFNKVALKWKANDFQLWINGVKRAADLAGLSPIGLDRFGFDLAGSGPIDAKIRDIRVYNTKEMTDSEVDILLTKITS